MSKPSRPDNKQQPAQGTLIAQQTTIYQGQMPPPQMLAEFEAILPGFTDRLLTIVEKESESKRIRDRRTINSFQLSTWIGMICAFLAVLAVCGVAIYAIYKGDGAVGGSIMASCVVGVIIAFIQRRKATQQEKNPK